MLIRQGIYTVSRPLFMTWHSGLLIVSFHFKQLSARLYREMIYLKLNCISILSYSRKIGVSLISAIALSEFSETNTCNQRLYLEWKGICSNLLKYFA